MSHFFSLEYMILDFRSWNWDTENSGKYTYIYWFTLSAWCRHVWVCALSSHLVWQLYSTTASKTVSACFVLPSDVMQHSKGSAPVQVLQQDVITASIIEVKAIYHYLLLPFLLREVEFCFSVLNLSIFSSYKLQLCSGSWSAGILTSGGKAALVGSYISVIPGGHKCFS